MINRTASGRAARNNLWMVVNHPPRFRKILSSLRENGLPPAGAVSGRPPEVPLHPAQAPSIDISIDFTRPDGPRTRPLLVEGKRLYVDEHYISEWSPVLRAWCIECPDRELILANVQYDHIMEMLECIHPTYKAIDDQSVHILLPLAYDYQMEGLLHRCECFLINHNLPFLEKVWIADRYKLNRLLVLCPPRNAAEQQDRSLRDQVLCAERSGESAVARAIAWRPRSRGDPGTTIGPRDVPTSHRSPLCRH
ncbi:unnamed protein product, partial [Mesorhabditis spiculigera]